MNWTHDSAKDKPMIWSNFTTFGTHATVYMPYVRSVTLQPQTQTIYAQSGDPGFVAPVRYQTDYIPLVPENGPINYPISLITGMMFGDISQN